jgi:hypothetical protein
MIFVAVTQEELMQAMQSGGATGGLLQAMQVIFALQAKKDDTTDVQGQGWLNFVLLQARLDGLVGKPSGLIETLPKPIQRRIKYLQNLQGEYDDREEEYEKELDELDKKYEKIYGVHLHQERDCSQICFLSWPATIAGGQTTFGVAEVVWPLEFLSVDLGMAMIGAPSQMCVTPVCFFPEC